MSAQNYKPHIFSLCALFVAGNAVISLPYFYANSPLWSLLITTAVSVVFVWIAAALVKVGLKSKAVFYITAPLICALAIYGTVTAIYDYICFVSEIQLPQASVVLLTFVFVITAAVFAISSNSSILKYSLLVAIISAACVILLFVSGIRHFDISQINPVFKKTNFGADATKIFFRYFSSLAVLLTFISLTKKISYTKTVTCGTAVGFLTIALCLAQSVLTLGVANDLPYPYIKAVGVISSGSLFTRLDGLVYFAFFATAITKAAVCIKTVILIIKTIFCKKRTEDL